jgi:hypothetical protein
LQTNAIAPLACLGAAIAGLAFAPALEQVTALSPSQTGIRGKFIVRAAR